MLFYHLHYAITQVAVNMPAEGLRSISRPSVWGKRAAALFMVAIMIGAAFYVAFNDLPKDDDQLNGRNVLVWDMDIHSPKKAGGSHHGSGLSMSMTFPPIIHGMDVQLRNPEVEVGYEVLGLSYENSNIVPIDRSTGMVTGNSILYPDVFEDIDLEFTVGANGLKEYFILKDPQPFLRSDLTIKTLLRYAPSALEPVQPDSGRVGGSIDTNGLVSMLDTRGKEVLRLAPPVMFDSSDRVDESRAITVPSDTATPPAKWSVGRLQVIETAQGAELSIVVPWEFLASPTTRYPVYIDPTISSPVTDNEWYYDSLILLQSDLDIVSGGALNLYNVTLRVDHDTVNEYNIQVHPNASFNVYRSWVEPSHEKGDKAYNFNCSGNLTVQDSRVNYTYDGIKVSWGNVSLRNATVQHSSNHGIDASSGNLTLFQSVFNNSASDGVHASNAHIDLLQSEVRDNTGKGVYLFNCVGNVSETEISANGADGLYITSDSELNVTECEVHGNAGTGIIISDAGGLVYGTDIYENLHGLNVTSGGAPEVINNTIHENDLNGVNIMGSSPTVSGNVITLHSAGAGLMVDAGTPTMGSNTLEENEVGVLAQNVATSLANLEILRSDDHGVRLASGNLTLVNCSVEWSGQSDIKVESSAELVALNTYFNKGNSDLTGASGHLTVKWYLDLQVLGEFDTPWVSHPVEIKDKGAAVVSNASTNATGWIPQQALVEYVQSSSAWDIRSPHTITANLTVAHVYMSTSRELVIYHTGDMDGDLVPDVKEDPGDRLWLEAESHGYGPSQIVEDPFAIDGRALVPWNGTDLIINKDTFFETFQVSPQYYMLMVRARSDHASDGMTVLIKNSVGTVLLNDTFPLSEDYYWFSTRWFSLTSACRLFINITAVPGNDGTVHIDRLCISPKMLPGNAIRATSGGQVTDPTVSDTDGDLMPEGDERRDGTVWLEAEHADTFSDTGMVVEDWNYSNGHACQLDEEDEYLEFELNDLLPVQLGPLPAGYYVIKVRACSTADVNFYLPVQDAFNQTLSVDSPQPTWYTLTGLRIKSGDSPPPKKLKVTLISGTCTIDKLGLVMVVDDCTSGWQSQNVFQRASDTTPAIFEDRIFTTSTASPHLRVIYGSNGTTVASATGVVSKVTSPTSTDGGVVYAVTQTSGTRWLRLVDEDGDEVWNNSNVQYDNIIGQAVLGEQVVLACDQSARGYSLGNGSLLWTYAPGANHYILTTPVVCGDYIVLLVKRTSPSVARYVRILNSTGALVQSGTLTTNADPLGTPAVANGKIIISYYNMTPYTYVDAYSFDTAAAPAKVWSYKSPSNTKVVTEPVVAGDSVYVIIRRTSPTTDTSVVRISQTNGYGQWTSGWFNGNILSRTPCYVDDRLYYMATLPTGYNAGTYLRCIDLAAGITSSQSPKVFDQIVSTQTPEPYIGSPVLGDLDRDGYLEAFFNIDGDSGTGGVRCWNGGGVWFVGGSAWAQYHRDERRSGDAGGVLTFYPTDPDDIDLDHDGLWDGPEVFSVIGAERFEFEDMSSFSACYMGSVYPGNMPGGSAFTGFFHQTGAALRSVDAAKDARVQQGYPEDSWVEVTFKVPTTGAYELRILPENGYQKKISKLLLRMNVPGDYSGCSIDEIRGSGYTGGLYTGGGDGYTYQGSKANDYSRGSVGVAMFAVDEAYLRMFIENATYITLSTLVNSTTSKKGYVPVELPPDAFHAKPAAITQPSFDLEQVYLQAFFDAALNVSLVANVNYYLRVGLDLDRVPQSLIDDQPFAGTITRLDLLDIDFGLALHRGCEPYDGDVDSDLLLDGVEADLELFPLAADADEDGISDLYEVNARTDPGNRDSDFDGIRDRVEMGMTQVETDQFTVWDTTETSSSLWERVMRYCQGKAENLTSTTATAFQNWDADNTTTTDPNIPDGDGDGLPDGCIDGWYYDPVAYSKGQYTTQSVSLGLYGKAYRAPYSTDYWGFVSSSNNVAEVWEGEDFDLDGAKDTAGNWSFDDGSDGKWNLGRRVGTYETDPEDDDSDSDGVADGYEVLYSVKPPCYISGQLIINPTVSDSGPTHDYDGELEPAEELDFSPYNDTQLTGSLYDAYAMRYTVSADMYLDSVIIDINASDGVRADCVGLEVFKCPSVSDTSDRSNMIASATSSTDGQTTGYTFRDLAAVLKTGANYVYWFIVRWRGVDFGIPLGTPGWTSYLRNAATGQWSLMTPGRAMHITFYTVSHEGDGLTTLEEYCAATDPKCVDTDRFQRSGMSYEDGLRDGQECYWVLRTNAVEGAFRYDGYREATVIDYDGDANGSDCDVVEFNRTNTTGIFNNPLVGFPGAGKDVIELAILPDRTQMFLNISSGTTIEHAIYVWKPGSNPRETSEYTNGTRYYPGECIRFLYAALSPETGNYTPTLTYYHKMLFLANPFKLDTDGDSIFDGDEVDWEKECSYAAAEGDSADWLNNARDRDSDNDGLMDGQEIEPFVDFEVDNVTIMDSDDYENMVDADSDGDGVKDGDELALSQDTDGDGSKNVADVDSDGDGLADGWIDGYRWDWTLSPPRFVICTGTPNQFNLWEGEDKDCDGAYDKESYESSPILNDTDGDGLLDGYNHGTGASFRFGELDNQTLGGYTAAGHTNQTNADTDADGLTDYMEVAGWNLTVGLRTSGQGYVFEASERTVMSDPTKNNTDDDELLDLAEFRFSDPTKNDTDLDGWLDHEEDSNGNGWVDTGETNPSDADTDDDGLLDGYELIDGHYMGEDADRDGDYDAGTDADPLNSDTDGDLLPDGAEHKLSATLKGDGYNDADSDGKINILDTDSDDDGLTDFEEACKSPLDTYDNGTGSSETDPYDPDTDNDGLYDGAEPTPGMDLPADNDGYTNGHDTNSNGDGGSDDNNETYVVFRTNAPLISGSWKHSYTGGGVWIAVDKNVSILHADDANPVPDYALDLSWGNAAFVYSSTNTSQPEGMGAELFVSKDYSQGHHIDNVTLRTPEGYTIYNASNGRIVVKVSSEIYYVFTHPGSEPSGYNSSKHNAIGFVGKRQEVYDWRKAITDDSDCDGVANSIDPMDYDADSDNDGVPDGREILGGVNLDNDGIPNWLDPDSDADGITDGTEMGYTEPVPGCTAYSGTNTSATFPGSNRTTWTADADPSTMTSPISADTDGDGFYDGWYDSYTNGILDGNETKGESTFNSGIISNYHNGKVDASECDPNDDDTDDDGLGDEDEWKNLSLDPLDPDSDADGLWDGLEMGVTVGLAGTDLALFVPDNDPKNQTDPTNDDTDGDGLLDGFEDRDHDGARDSNETNANLTDTDGDSLEDGDEDANADHIVNVNEDNEYTETDPLCNDTDADGLLDGGTSGEDEDSDAVVDEGETDPKKQDTDGDGLSDGIELGGWQISVYYEATGEKKVGYPKNVSSEPLEPDSDDDDLIDGAEFENATDPTVADTDGDGMTDLEELTADEPSDPCGVEGTPPNLTDLRIESVPVYRTLFGDLKYKWGSKLVVVVRAYDNVGLSWLEFKLKDIGTERWTFEEGKKDDYAFAMFEKEFLKSLVSGYDLNITVSDINGNVAFLERHINSLWEDFVAWLLEGIKSLCQFMMELASKAIAWIWNFIENIIHSVLEPIQGVSSRVVDSNLIKFEILLSEYENTGDISSQTQESIPGIFYNQLYVSVFIILSCIFLISKIIEYFAPFISGLVIGVTLAIIVIIVAVLASGIPFEKSVTVDSILSMNSELNGNKIKADINDFIFKEIYDDRSISLSTVLAIIGAIVDWAIIVWTLIETASPIADVLLCTASGVCLIAGIFFNYVLYNDLLEKYEDKSVKFLHALFNFLLGVTGTILGVIGIILVCKEPKPSLGLTLACIISVILNSVNYCQAASIALKNQP